MNKITMFKTIIISLIVLVIFSFGYGCNAYKNRVNFNKNIKVDTLYVRDTIVSEKPVFVELRGTTYKIKVPIINPISVPSDSDTLYIHDTTYIYLDREQVVWQDERARVYASGYAPQVDSVIHFSSEMIVTRTEYVKKRTRWGLGVQAGWGVGVANGAFVSHPYIGVGVSYNIVSW